MDKDVLVKAGQEIVRLLDQTKIKPRAAVWVFNPDNDIWRLWIVATKKKQDQREFYRLLSESVTNNRDSLQGIDVSDIELVDESHPAIQGLQGFISVEGLSDVHMSNNTFNGFYLPDGIILRMAL